MDGSADAPLVDGRLFVGLIFVIGVQCLVWLIAGVIWFGAGGTASDYVAITFFGIILTIACAIAALVIGLGPGVALWVAVTAICKRAGLSERHSALIAAPSVALTVSAICLLAIIYSVSENPVINRELVLSALVFLAPASVAAEVYAARAWPKTATHEEAGT